MKRYNVLIIEDAPDLLEDWPELLSTYEIDSHATGDYREALQLLNEGSYDCIILDIKMPVLEGMSDEETDNGRLTGIVICKLLREANPSVPILVVTSLKDLKAHSLARSAGANYVITKPCYPDQIVERIKLLTRES